MTAIVTIRIVCNIERCANFVVLETDSITSARRMLAVKGWKVFYQKQRSGNNARPYGDKCPDCAEVQTGSLVYRYAEDSTARKVIGDALPRRKRT